MVGLAGQAVELGRWAVFTFHGINEGNLLAGESDFAELVDFLAHRKDIWTAPLVEIGAYVRDRQI
jgi:hypothetical protein